MPDITGWWQAQDHEWTAFRERLMEILQEEVTYQRIAKLVGPDALPDHQRLILLLADLIKNAFLQQNSFDDIDMYCAPNKQVWMLRTLVNFADRCLELIRRGASLADIRDMRCLTAVVRMKSTVPNDDAQAMTDVTSAIGKELDELERRFA